MNAESPLVVVTDLRVAYSTPRRTVVSLDGVDLTISPGEIVGIVGESGSGKSTLASALVGTLAANATVTGSTVVAGVEMQSADPEARRSTRRNKLGVIGQNPITSMDPTRTVARTFADMGAGRARAVQALESVGLPDPARVLASFPHQLSGGMAQRVAIALAVVNGPELLIADEPTSSLDAQIADSILRTLVDQAKAQQAALIIVTHDLGVVAEFCERVVVMSRGRIVEDGPAERVFSAPRDEYTRMLLSATRLLQGEGRPTMPTFGAPVVEIRDATVSFRSGPPWARSTTTPVRDFSLSIAEGEMVGLVGPSGSGKTTISRLLLGLQRAESGAILMDGRPLRSPRRGSPGAVQVVLQHPDWALDPKMKVGASIMEPLAIVAGEKGESAREKMRALMDRMGLDHDLADRYPHELSGGQRQRASIARALIAKPRLVIFDEAVSSLDVSVQAQVLRLISSLRMELRFSGLFVSHDHSAVAYAADRIIDLGASDAALEREPAA